MARKKKAVPFSDLSGFGAFSNTGKTAASTQDPNSELDVFVCHASEDKDAFVRPLAIQMKKLGVDVWYDEFSMELGDSLSRSIDKGLSRSRCGLVVLSHSFFKKKWPQHELGGLVAREIGAEKRIIPIWLDVTREDVLQFSPTLADKLSLPATAAKVDQAALRLLKVIRPDVYQSLLRRAALQKVISSAKVKKVSADTFKSFKDGPIRHKSLPRTFLIRLRIVIQGLRDVISMPESEWIENFKRDMDPFHELEIWEIIFSIFQDATAEADLSKAQKKAIFSTLLMLTMGADPKQAFEPLPANLHSLVFDKAMSFFSNFKKTE